MLCSLVFVLRVLICVFRFLPGVSGLMCLKEVITKDVYLAETIYVPSTTAGREKETLLKTCRQECAQQRALCPRANRHTALGNERWHTAPPQPSWYHPNAPEFQCSRSAASLWGLLGGLDCGKRAPLHLARAWEQLQFETYKYFFTPSSFQLMCRWKPHRWSVGENPCLAKDGLLLLWNAIRVLGAEGFVFKDPSSPFRVLRFILKD